MQPSYSLTFLLQLTHRIAFGFDDVLRPAVFIFIIINNNKILHQLYG